MKQPPPGRFQDHDDDDDGLLELLRLETAPARSTCPSLAEIRAAEADVLEGDAGRAVAAHVAACHACHALAASARAWDGPDLAPAADARIRARLGLASPAQRRPGRGLAVWLLPLAAAAALAVAVPLLLRPPERERPSPAPSAAAYLIPFERLERRTAPSLVVRGEDAFDEEMARALAPYEAGDVDEAVARLTALTARFPEAASVRLYLGVAELLRGRPSDAVRALQEAEPRARAFWAPHVRWYLAVARERNGQRAAARADLEELCRIEGEYRARACSALAAFASAPPRSPVP